MKGYVFFRRDEAAILGSVDQAIILELIRRRGPGVAQVSQAEWLKLMPWLSHSTLRRNLLALQGAGLLIVRYTRTLGGRNQAVCYELANPADSGLKPPFKLKNSPSGELLSYKDKGLVAFSDEKPYGLAADSNRQDDVWKTAFQGTEKKNIYNVVVDDDLNNPNGQADFTARENFLSRFFATPTQGGELSSNQQQQQCIKCINLRQEGEGPSVRELSKESKPASIEGKAHHPDLVGFMRLWLEYSEKGNFLAPKRLSPQRIERLQKLLSDRPSLADWRTVLDMALRSDYLRGKMTLDWFLDGDHALRVEEGYYVSWKTSGHDAVEPTKKDVNWF